MDNDLFIYFSILSIITFLHLLIIFLILYKRNDQPIKLSGSLLLSTISVGSLYTSIVLFSYLYLPSQNLLCQLGSYRLVISIATIYSPLLLKIYRIYKIYDLPLNEIKDIENNRYILKSNNYYIHEYYLLWLNLCILCILLSIKELLQYVFNIYITDLSLGCISSNTVPSVDEYLYIFIGGSYGTVLFLLILLYIAKDLPPYLSGLNDLKLFTMFSFLVALTYTLFYFAIPEHVFNLTILLAIEYVRNVGVIGILVLIPLVSVYFSTPKVLLFSSCDSLLTLDTLLHDIVCVQYFRKWLITEWSVEVLLAWVELELYKDTPPYFMNKESNRLMYRYFEKDSELEIALPANFVDPVKQSIAFNSCNAKTFLGVQNCLFTMLSIEYPKFLASDACKSLLLHLEREELTEQTLKLSEMI